VCGQTARARSQARWTRRSPVYHVNAPWTTILSREKEECDGKGGRLGLGMPLPPSAVIRLKWRDRLGDARGASKKRRRADAGTDCCGTCKRPNARRKRPPKQKDASILSSKRSRYCNLETRAASSAMKSARAPEAVPSASRRYFGDLQKLSLNRDSGVANRYDPPSIQGLAGALRPATWAFCDTLVEIIRAEYEP